MWMIYLFSTYLCKILQHIAFFFVIVNVIHDKIMDRKQECLQGSCSKRNPP